MQRLKNSLRNITIKLFKFISKVLRSFKAEKLPFFPKTSQFVYHLLINNKVNMDGFDIYLDSNDSLGLSIFGRYEPLEIETIKKEIQEGSVFVDIGANIGYHTLHLARHVGEKGHIYAFEPDEENYALLEKNVQINGINNVTLIKKAVSNKVGTAKLYLSDINKADHQIYKTKEIRKAIVIETTTLDDYFASYSGSIDFIKMDIQGSEYLAFKGMRSILKKYPNIKMVMEYWPAAIKACGEDPKKFLDDLLSLGFSFYDVNDANKSVIPINKAEIIAKYSLKPGIYTNLLCKRR